ncbi:Protein of unknown function [Bacillus mycoides]|nr:Protein of unknown function [Bacillus mycoides]
MVNAQNVKKVRSFIVKHFMDARSIKTDVILFYQPR